MNRPAIQPTPSVQLACQATAALLAVMALVLAALAALSPPLALPEAAFACALASLGALRLAGTLQRRALASSDFLDTSTGLCNRQGLAPVGQPLLDATRRSGRPFCVVVLDFSELAEVRDIYGREVARRVMHRIVHKLHSLAGPGGLALRTGRNEFTVLLPGIGREGARAAVQRVLGKPCRIEFDAGDSEIVLVPEVVAESVASDGESLAEVHAEISRGLAAARQLEIRRMQWMRRERERHSRPLPLAA